MSPEPLTVTEYPREEYDAAVKALEKSRNEFLKRATARQKKGVEWLEQTISDGISMPTLAAVLLAIRSGSVDGAQRGLFTNSYHDATKFLAVALASHDKSFVDIARKHLLRSASASEYDISVHPTAKALEASLIQHEQEVKALVSRAMTVSLDPVAQTIYDTGKSIFDTFKLNPLRREFLEGSARQAFIDEVKTHRQMFLDNEEDSEFRKSAKNIAVASIDKLLQRWEKPDRIVLRAKDVVKDMDEIADDRTQAYSNDAFNIIAKSFSKFAAVKQHFSQARARG